MQIESLKKFYKFEAKRFCESKNEEGWKTNFGEGTRANQRNLANNELPRQHKSLIV